MVNHYHLLQSTMHWGWVMGGPLPDFHRKSAFFGFPPHFSALQWYGMSHIIYQYYRKYIVACQRGRVSNEPPGQRQDTGPGILWSVHRLITNFKRNEPHTWFAFLTKTGWAWHVTILPRPRSWFGDPLRLAHHINDHSMIHRHTCRMTGKVLCDIAHNLCHAKR